jgi:hypothetical protein
VLLQVFENQKYFSNVMFLCGMGEILCVFGLLVLDLERGLSGGLSRFFG